MVDSLVAVGGGPTGSSSSSVAEWKLSSSLGGAGESSVSLVPLVVGEFPFEENYMHVIVHVKKI